MWQERYHILDGLLPGCEALLDGSGKDLSSLEGKMQV